MDRATFDRETSIHRQAYGTLRDQIRRDYRGQYVVLAKGQLIAAEPSFAEAMAALQRLQPVPDYYLIFQAETEPAFELAYDL